MKEVNSYNESIANKENSSLRMNYSFKKDRKYAYAPQQPPRPLRCHSDKQVASNQLGELERLRQQLQEQRQKVKYLQSRTIQQQCSVLQHLETLESKFSQITSEKQKLEQQLKQIKSQNEWKSKYQSLQVEHKKIKAISDSLVDMMYKVAGCNGDIHDAWRWVKRVVWEYEGIRKKAAQWKEVYDQVTQAVQIIGQNNYA